MSELTKEQIEAFARSPYPALAVGDQEALCALALEALDARAELEALRADAAIGRAVRNSGVTLAWLIERCRELRNSRGSLALSSVVYADAHAQEIALVDAIASALREEGR